MSDPIHCQGHKKILGEILKVVDEARRIRGNFDEARRSGDVSTKDRFFPST
jgi:hypothetical protein